MPDTFLGILIAVAVILPGFVIVELSTVSRPAAKRSDLEIVLRALFYALVLHLLASPYTKCLVERVGSFDHWTSHLGAIALYVAIVLIGIPLAVGLELNSFFLREERKPRGRPSRLYEILGGRDSGDAGDLFFTRLHNGAWLIVQLVDGRWVGGRFGIGSGAGQTPAPHDLYIYEMWEVLADEKPDPVFGGMFKPSRGIYISADQIRTVRVLRNPEQAGGD